MSRTILACPRVLRARSAAPQVSAAHTSVATSATHPTATEAVTARPDPAVSDPAMSSYTPMNTGRMTATVKTSTTLMTSRSAAG